MLYLSVTFVHTAPTTPSNIIPTAPPVAMLRPSPNNTVIIGNTAVFHCSSSFGSPPFTFVWSEGGVIITDGVVSNSTESSLTIPAVTLLVHNGIDYQCNVSLDRPDGLLVLSSTAISTLEVQGKTCEHMRNKS